MRNRVASVLAMCAVASIPFGLGACNNGGGGGGRIAFGVPTQSSTAALSANDRVLVVVNSNDDSISVFDPSVDTLPLLAKIPVGAEPRSVSVTPDGKRAY